jgi:hypothetical protein
MAHRVTNWPEYEEGLRSRGSLTLWITPEALAQWMGRYKVLIGPRLRARHPDAQQTEAAIGVAVRNRMLAAARPKSVRGQVPAA